MVPIRIIGDPFSISGYSEHCRELCLALHDIKYDMSIGYVQQDPTKLPGAYVDILKPCVNKDNKAEVDVYITIPPVMKKSNKKVVAVCTFENSGLPRGWADMLNSVADLVIVPSKFNIETFTDAGVKVPIRVAHEGYDPSVYTPSGPPLGLKFGLDTFKFVTMSNWSLRKGWDRLLVAYLTAFNQFSSPELIDKVALVMKIYGDVGSPSFKSAVRQNINSVKQALGFADKDGKNLISLPKIYVMFNSLSPVQLASLYREADAFVLATRGEGFNRGALHASAIGKPVVTSDWSGHLDFLNKDNSYLVGGTLAPCVVESGTQPFYTGENCWFDIDIKELGQTMKQVVNDRLVGNSPKTAYKDIVDNYKWSKVVLEFVEAIKGVKDE